MNTLVTAGRGSRLPRSTDDVRGHLGSGGRGRAGGGAAHHRQQRRDHRAVQVPHGAAREFMRRWVVPELEPKWRVVFHERDAGVGWPRTRTWTSNSGTASKPVSATPGAAPAAARLSRPVLDEGAHASQDCARSCRRTISIACSSRGPRCRASSTICSRFPPCPRRDSSTRSSAPSPATAWTSRSRAGRRWRAISTRSAPVARWDRSWSPFSRSSSVRTRRGTPLLTTADYDALGGVKGILGSHIDFLLEHVPGEPDPAIGWAVLRRAVRTPVDVVTDLTDVARRFDVPIEVPQQVLTWLEQDRRVLRENTGGGHDIVPGLLAVAVTAHVRRLDELTENVRAMLRYGVRQFAESGALLPDQHFRRINEQRRLLTTTEDEATLMLRCALGHSEAGNRDEIAHWLRRVRNEATKIEILLDMLFDIRPELRARAAACLREFRTPDVRAQLHLVALRDAEDQVRAAAVDSLGVLRTDALCMELVKETIDPNSPFQLQAIDALRVFPNAEAVAALVHIVSGAAPAHDRVARARAIASLGAQDTDASRLALVQIALDDPDEEDRAAAVKAIGGVGSDAAAAQLLEAVAEAPAPTRQTQWRQLSWARVAKAAGISVTGLAAVMANVLVHGLLLGTIGRRRLGVIITVAETTMIAAAWASLDLRALMLMLWALSLVTGYLVPTGVLLQRRSDGQPMTSYERAVGRILFLFGCVTGFLLVHGLASTLTGHVKRGLTLTAFEAAGLWLIALSYRWSADLGPDQPVLRAVFWQTYESAQILFVIGIVVLATTYVLGIRTAAADIVHVTPPAHPIGSPPRCLSWPAAELARHLRGRERFPIGRWRPCGRGSGVVRQIQEHPATRAARALGRGRRGVEKPIRDDDCSQPESGVGRVPPERRDDPPRADPRGSRDVDAPPRHLAAGGTAGGGPRPRDAGALCRHPPRRQHQLPVHAPESGAGLGRRGRGACHQDAGRPGERRPPHAVGAGATTGGIRPDAKSDRAESPARRRAGARTAAAPDAAGRGRTRRRDRTAVDECGNTARRARGPQEPGHRGCGRGAAARLRRRRRRARGPGGGVQAEGGHHRCHRPESRICGRCARWWNCSPARGCRKSSSSVPARWPTRSTSSCGRSITCGDWSSTGRSPPHATRRRRVATKRTRRRSHLRSRTCTPCAG